MCPACVASTAWIVAGVSSTGGLTALAAKLLRSKNSVEKVELEGNQEQEPKHDQTIKEK
jgi:hypothetical protein